MLHRWFPSSTFGFILGALVGCAGSQTEELGPPEFLPIQDAMRSMIDEGEIAGAVTIVANAREILHQGVVGHADVAIGKPMQPDSIFWIASMTKPVTATAVLMLHEEGKLGLDDPVAKHLPEFASLKHPAGARADITIRHLLTHSSGMGELSRTEQAGVATLAEAVSLYVKKPLRFVPGSRWVYSQSGINTAARVVEVLSGQPFHEFLTQRIFEPLGMPDTAFYLSEEQAVRLATSYRRTEEGELQSSELAILHGKPPTSIDRFPAANGGLFSTAQDYTRFAQFILGRGVFAGRRYLSADSVRAMTTPKTGDLVTGFTPGNAWGLGWCVIREPQGVTEMVSSGTYGHGGAYGTQAWIDPEAERIYILMVQRANFPNADASVVRFAFQDAAQGIPPEEE